MKRFVLNASDRTDGCFTAAFFQTQHASFSSGAVAPQRLAVALEHKRQNNHTVTRLRLPFQANAHIMDLGFKDFAQ
jgi:hypothetical protein